MKAHSTNFKVKGDCEVSRLQNVYREYLNSDYKSKWSEVNTGNQAILRERLSALSSILEKFDRIPLTDQYVLDVGCGSGNVLGILSEWGANPKRLYGIDILTERIDNARQQLPAINFQVCNAEAMSFDNRYFDLVFVSTVFSSILDADMRRNVAGEIDRVLKTSGAVVWYDFRYNNPWNPNVRGMKKKAIRELFPKFSFYLTPITLLPPLARKLGNLTNILYPALTSFPLVRTHYIGLLRKPD